MAMIIYIHTIGVNTSQSPDIVTIFLLDFLIFIQTILLSSKGASETITSYIPRFIRLYMHNKCILIFLLTRER